MRRYAFTLVELLVVIGILAVLAAILFPTLSGVKKDAKIADCSNNLRQTGYSLGLYAGDHDDRLPVEVEPVMLVAIEEGHTSLPEPWRTELLDAPHWPVAIFSYGATKETVHCPLDQARADALGVEQPSSFSEYGTSYGYDDLAALDYQTFSGIPNPTTESLSYDFGSSVHGPLEADSPVNCLHMDLHIKQMPSVDCSEEAAPMPQ